MNSVVGVWLAISGGGPISFSILLLVLIGCITPETYSLLVSFFMAALASGLFRSVGLKVGVLTLSTRVLLLVGAWVGASFTPVMSISSAGSDPRPRSSSLLISLGFSIRGYLCLLVNTSRLG